MELAIEWQQPVQLTRRFEIVISHRQLPKEIEPIAGVYFFSRKNGDNYTPFYIGESLNVRKRLRNHLKSKAIADVLRGFSADDVRIKNGTRFFHYGYFRAKRGQQPKKCIKIIQSYMIRAVAEEEIPILNFQLKTVKTHKVLFGGSDKARGWFEPRFNIEI